MGEALSSGGAREGAACYSPAAKLDASLFGLQTVGESLLYMLEKCLGAAFSPDVREAWTKLYGAVVKAMRRGWEPLVEGD